MQPLHSFATGLAGLALGAIISALIVIRGIGWRSVVGTFLVGAIGLFGGCLAILFRSNATSVAVMDISLRCNQISTIVMIWATHELYRSVTAAPRTRTHRLVQWVIIAFAAYAALSPGGIMYQRITAVEIQALPFGDAISLPVAERDAAAKVALIVAVFIGVRLTLMSLRRDLKTELWNRALLVAAALIFCASFSWILVTINNRSVIASLYPMPFTLAVMAVQAVKAQRRWSEEHALAQARVRDTESKLAAVLAHGQTLAGILTPEGTLLMANRRALEMAGVCLAQVVGKAFVDSAWFNGVESQQVRAKLAIEKAAKGEADRFQYTFRSPHGTNHEMDVLFTPYRDDDGRVQWIIAEGRDITELVMFEKRAREEQRLEVMGQLAGGIAHDFNNMLAGIMGSAEMAREICKQPEVNEDLNLIVDTARSAAELTGQLLMFARRGAERWEHLDVHRAIQSASTLFSRVAGRNVQVSLKCEATHRFTLGDEAALKSALLNLLVNARDAMPTGGHITVTTSNVHLSDIEAARFAQPLEPGQYILLSVQDEGSGIPLELLPRIFEPFFTTKARGMGTGLGLAAVLGCVRDHAGGIEVQSVVGRGTVFSLYLPVATASLDSWRKTGGRVIDARQGQRALVIDDEPIVLNAIVRQLSRLGIESQSAETAEDAVIKLNMMSAPPTIAFIDLHLRGMSGCDVAQALRSRLPNIPVVIMSGNFGDIDLTKLRMDPKVRLLAKPARAQELGDVLLSLDIVTDKSNSMPHG